MFREMISIIDPFNRADESKKCLKKKGYKIDKIRSIEVSEVRCQKLSVGPCIISRNLISLGYYSIDQFVYLITIRYYSYSLWIIQQL